jgi:hypothetical protein
MSTGESPDAQGYTDEELIRMYDPFAFEHHREQEGAFSDSEDETGFTLQEGGTVNPLISISSPSKNDAMPVRGAYSDKAFSDSEEEGFSTKGRWVLIGGLSIAVAVISIIVLVIIASLPSHPSTNQVVIQRTSTPADTVIATSTVPLTQATTTLTPSPTPPPTATPIVRPTVSSCSGQSPSGAIASPTSNSQVSIQETATGTASCIPSNKHLWLLVQVDGVVGYYPQSPDPLPVSGKKWSGSVVFGVAGDTGRSFTLSIVAMDASGQSAVQSYYASAPNYNPIYPMPSGTVILNQIMVTRK